MKFNSGARLTMDIKSKANNCKKLQKNDLCKSQLGILTHGNKQQTCLALSLKEVITNRAMYYTFPMLFQKYITAHTKHVDMFTITIL